MVERVFAPADVERVAVGQKGLAAALLDEVRDRFCPVRAQEREVARLAEVELDRGELFIEVDLVRARRLHQAGELLLEVFGQCCAEIRKINLGFFHMVHPFLSYLS